MCTNSTTAGAGCHANEASHEALWSAMILFLSAVVGERGMVLGLKAFRDSPAFASGLATAVEKKNWRHITTGMPSTGTVSQAIHDTTSPTGAVFRAYFVACAVLSLISQFPKHDGVAFLDRGAGWTEIVVLISAYRSSLPALAILLLVMVPVSTDYVQLLERMTDPEYTLSDEDRRTYRANTIQTSVHNRAGLLGFLVLPLVELSFAILAVVDFTNAGRGAAERRGDNVAGLSSVPHDSLAGIAWLGLAVLRFVVLAAALLSIVKMQVEMWAGTKWKETPLVIALPEMWLIRDNLLVMRVTAMGMLFSSPSAVGRPFALQVAFVVGVAVQGLWIAKEACYHIYGCCVLHSIVGDRNMRREVERLARTSRKRAETSHKGIVKMQKLMTIHRVTRALHDAVLVRDDSAAAARRAVGLGTTGAGTGTGTRAKRAMTTAEGKAAAQQEMVATRGAIVVMAGGDGDDGEVEM